MDILRWQWKFFATREMIQDMDVDSTRRRANEWTIKNYMSMTAQGAKCRLFHVSQLSAAL